MAMAEEAREGWALVHVMRQDPERAAAHRDDRVRALGGPLLLKGPEAASMGPSPVAKAASSTASLSRSATEALSTLIVSGSSRARRSSNSESMCASRDSTGRVPASVRS